MIKTNTCNQCKRLFNYQTWNSKGIYCCKQCYWNSKKGNKELAKNFGNYTVWNKGKSGYKYKEVCKTPYEVCKDWRAKNIDIVRHYGRQYWYKRRLAKGNHTYYDWIRIKEQYNNSCASCGISEKEKRLTEDHIIPISKGGTNNIDNIQPLCVNCNCSKSAKLDWQGITK